MCIYIHIQQQKNKDTTGVNESVNTGTEITVSCKIQTKHDCVEKLTSVLGPN